MTGTDEDEWDFAVAQRYADDVLTGDRIRLRGLRESDLDALVSWRRAPGAEVLQADAVNPPAEAVVKDRLRSHASASNSSDRRGFCVETLEEASGSPRLLGFVTLSSISLQHRSAEFAIALDPDSGGHGFGADATRTMVRYGFRELGLHRVWLTVWRYNERARRVYLRAGFLEEGRLRDAVFHDGRWHDQLVMSALATDPGWI